MHSDPEPPSETEPLVIRPMTQGDLPFVSRLHLESLNHGLFPALGYRFLKAYLNTFIVSPFAVALIAEDDGVPLGYLVGTLEDRAHYGHIVKRWGPRLAVNGLIALSTRPMVAFRFLRTRAFRYARGAIRLAGGSPSGPAQAPARKDAVLTHMAVVASARSRGVGRRLAETFIENARRSGADGVALTTRASARGAAGFYEKLGWCVVTEFVDRDGLAWQRLRLDLDRS